MGESKMIFQIYQTFLLYGIKKLLKNFQVRNIPQVKTSTIKVDQYLSEKFKCQPQCLYKILATSTLQKYYQNDSTDNKHIYKTFYINVIDISWQHYFIHQREIQLIWINLTMCQSIISCGRTWLDTPYRHAVHTYSNILVLLFLCC